MIRKFNSCVCDKLRYSPKDCCNYLSVELSNLKKPHQFLRISIALQFLSLIYQCFYVHQLKNRVVIDLNDCFLLKIEQWHPLWPTYTRYSLRLNLVMISWLVIVNSCHLKIDTNCFSIRIWILNSNKFGCKLATENISSKKRKIWTIQNTLQTQITNCGLIFAAGLKVKFKKKKVSFWLRSTFENEIHWWEHPIESEWFFRKKTMNHFFTMKSLLAVSKSFEKNKIWFAKQFRSFKWKKKSSIIESEF